MELITTVLFLGIAGLDLSGAMIVIAAYTLGAKYKDLCIFATIDFIGTVAIGVACSSVLRNNIDRLTECVTSLGVVVELVVAGLLIVWLARRVFHKNEEYKDFLKPYLDKGMLSVACFCINCGCYIRKI